MPLAANLHSHLLELYFELSFVCSPQNGTRPSPLIGNYKKYIHMAAGYCTLITLSTQPLFYCISNKTQTPGSLVPPDGSPCSNSSSRMTEKSVVVSVKLKKWFLKRQGRMMNSTMDNRLLLSMIQHEPETMQACFTCGRQ